MWLRVATGVEQNAPPSGGHEVAFGAMSSMREGHSADEDDAESSADWMEQGHGVAGMAGCLLAARAGAVLWQWHGEAEGARCRGCGTSRLWVDAGGDQGFDTAGAWWKKRQEGGAEMEWR